MDFNFSKDDYGGVKNTGLEKADLLMELMMAGFGSTVEIETKLEAFLSDLLFEEQDFNSAKDFFGHVVGSNARVAQNVFFALDNKFREILGAAEGSTAQLAACMDSFAKMTHDSGPSLTHFDMG